MHILVTNDDGVYAPGLLALATAMREVAGVHRVSVLAPDRNWSASGHVKTLSRPLRVSSTKLADGTEALMSDGAPSDCVALALLGMVEEKVDLIVSGINPNGNLGQDVTYSGTVTAVMEGCVWHVPGVAVSLAGEAGKRPLDYCTAAMVAQEVVGTIVQQGIPSGVFLNVNVPYVGREELRGIRMTRQGLRVYHDRLDKRLDPRGVPYYWIGGDIPTGVPEDGTDVGALAAGYASVTPLQLDLTAHSQMRRFPWPNHQTE